MSVYVDDMVACSRNSNWPYDQACHMAADTVEELHKFARRLGLRRSWFQSGSLPHYDLTIGMRVKAVWKEEGRVGGPVVSAGCQDAIRFAPSEQQ